MANFVENTRKSLGYGRQDLAKKLGMGVATIRMYEKEKRYDGYVQKIPMVFRYALAALKAGLSPIGGKQTQTDGED